MKIRQRALRASVLLSYFFSGMFVLLLLALCFLLPRLVPVLVSVPDLIGDRGVPTEETVRFLLFLSYLAVAVALVAVGFLFAILHAVSHERVFSSATVRALYAVAVCCLAEGLIFLAIGSLFQLALLLFAMAGFLALCLYIVGNVISVAIDYKAENDLTV